jgi:hypothetical protein|nr:MAG TPA: Protein of unknown function (DUF1642) [Caudoviricetes sp.]
MNKQELIKEFEEIGIHGLNMFGTVVKGIPTETAITLIKQLDEPRKVKVKQFVADWYERNENDLDYNIWDYIYNWEDQEESEFKNWFNCSKKAFQTLVNMHQFGYEVDEEKRYLVKIKASGQYIMNNPDENAVFFYSSRAYSKLTRKELEEAGFGWVFDCEGVEIEEVTD